MRPSQPSPLTSALVARVPIFYGWVILSVASLTMFTSGPGQTYTFSVFVDPIINDTGLSRSMVSGLYTAGSLTAATGMVLVGRLLDRYGARVMTTIVGVLFGFAALWMSQVSNPAELYAGFAAMRLLGQGSLTLIPTTVVAVWFIRLRGRVMAINSLGSAASFAAFPPLIHLMISIVGWRGAWVSLAFIIWGILLLPAILLLRRSPESVGLRPDGDSVTDQTTEMAGLARPTLEINLTLGEALRTRAFWLLLFAGSSQALISTALVFHHVSLITGKGLDAGLAATVFSVLAPMSLVGNFIAGYLADRYPNRYLLAIAQVILAAAMLWTFVIFQPWQALAYGAILGLASGFFMNITGVIWPNYYGRRHLGSIRGVVTTSMVAFAALGPWPFGLLADLTGGYTRAIVIFLALPVACAAASMAAKPPVRLTTAPLS